MARPRDDAAHARRKEAFLDATAQLLQTTGYQAMTIGDVLQATGASKGAFYHYFGSKQDLLEALLNRMREQVVTTLEPLVADENLSARQKLDGFVDRIATWKTARHEAVVAASRAWYSDQNVMPRQKFRDANVDSLTEVLGAILRQAVAEKLCDISDPELTGRMALVLMYDLNDRLRHYWIAQDGPTERDRDTIAHHIDVYTSAITRLLGLTEGDFVVVDDATLDSYFS